MCLEQDQYFMELAFQEAEKAAALGEVPVGAVLVCEGELIARAHNAVEQRGTAIAHAELLVLEEACKKRGEKYLQECTLYVTLEPCVMCAGACFWTQIKQLVFAARDKKRGYQRCRPSIIHPKTTVRAGIFQERSTRLLQSFFQKLRRKS